LNRTWLPRWPRADLVALGGLALLVAAAVVGLVPAAIASAPPPTGAVYTYDSLASFAHGAPADHAAVRPAERSASRGRVVPSQGPLGLIGGFGVAAEGAADDWPVISGIVRDSGKGKGYFGLGEGTASQATRAGESWVGDGYRVASDGKTLVSRDGLRTFRPPSWKPGLRKYQANFEYWLEERVGKPFGNGHLDITELGT
jgi:hypothetical protein